MKKKILTLDETFKELESLNRPERKSYSPLISGSSGTVFMGRWQNQPVDNSDIDKKSIGAKLKKK